MSETKDDTADSFENDDRYLPVNRITPEMWREARRIAVESTHENLTKADIATLIWAEYLY